VAAATEESLPVEIRAVGAGEASETVQIKSQIAGELLRTHFVEGGEVGKGDLLFEIDPRPYREALRQAEAAVTRDMAQLQQAEANSARDQAQSKFASADAARYEELAKAGVVARAQYDQARSNADALTASIRAGQAAIASARAALESDRAAVDRARLDLSYCEIRSPIAGRAGNLLVHAGNLVKANDTPLVVINKTRPIFVTFAVPEDRLAEIRRAAASRKLPVEVSPQDESKARAQGTLAVIDNTVDGGTGTIKLKAAIPNEAGLLWPGQFVNVIVTLGTLRNATVLPAEAVQPGQKGPFVYVVKPDKTVEPRQVTLGASRGGRVVVEKGVAPGEKVVIDGQLRLFPGAHIEEVASAKIDSQPL
jgi:multidrug efflux system membrane fusion protein